MAESTSVQFQRGNKYNHHSPSNNGDTSNSCESAVWDPACDNGEDSHDNYDSNDSRSSRRQRHQSASMFPSQIDVAFSAKRGGVVDANISDGINEIMETSSRSSSESDDDLSNEVFQSNNNDNNNDKTPPERIRYEMLGAPTLLYRHAPSYLSPENRPSTLSPQQLFMALYTKDHPVMDWFSPKTIDTARRSAPRPCPFLTSTNVPCPSRPWGSTTTSISSSDINARNDSINEEGMNVNTDVCAVIQQPIEEPDAQMDLELHQSMGINSTPSTTTDANISSIPPTSNNPKCQVVPTEVGGPSGFGNCLLTIPCQCQHCDLRQPCWFLVHPSGDNLSSVSMSKLSFPRNLSHHGNQTATNGVDAGGRILQISQCGPRLKSIDGSVCLVARTSHYCTVIYAHPIFVTSMEQEVCGTNYELQKKARIDMSPQLPVFIACDPKTTFSHFACPSFAILGRDSPGRCTTIHRVLVRDEPTVKVLSLAASLSDISLLEFCSDDRMSLWAAALSIVMPKLAPGFFKKTMGTLAGYGHSLHRIDLRNNSSSFIWSPSHVHYLTEGLHSINGIMADANNEHLLWVSSTSACNVWALDVRHKPARVVVSWSLPFLCDDIGSHLPVSGIYGRGVIFSQPTSIRSSSMNNGDIESSPVMFSLQKDSNTSVLGVHHMPPQMPRFQAKPLESAGFQDDSNSSIARSAVFPLPDVAGSVFNMGLATMRCSSKTCLNDKQHRQLDYRKPPANVTYVITMTSLGDMYCHSLLESNALEKSRALQYPGLPVGTKAIPHPGKLNITIAISGHMRITLSNRFPIPSSAITPYIILNPDDCCPFNSYDIIDILNREPMPESRVPGASAELASKANAPRSMYNVSESEYDISGKKFKVACHEGNDCDMKSNIVHHSFPRFGTVLPNQTSQCRDNIQNGRHYRPITVDPSHLVVATWSKKKDEGYDSSNDSINNKLSPKETFGKLATEELEKDIINALQARYYCKNDANDFGVVKGESNSDNEWQDPFYLI